MAKFWPDGTAFQINSVTVGGLDNISGPAGTRGEIDLSDFDSGGDAEFTAGIRDNGTIELSGKFDPQDTGQTELKTQFDGDGVPVAWVITLPTTAGVGPFTLSGNGYVSAFNPEFPQDAAATFSATVRVSGAYTIA